MLQLGTIIDSILNYSSRFHSFEMYEEVIALRVAPPGDTNCYDVSQF